LNLYNLLYIQRHSPLNPQYTLRYFQNLISNRAMEIIALRKAGQIDAFLGYFELGGTMVTPVVGYDTSLPQAVGLYRMISYLAHDIALKNGFVDHASAGAGMFKRNRGRQPVAEYSAVYSQHLSPLRRRVWSLIKKGGDEFAARNARLNGVQF
jgi:hypothetical protein